MPTKHFNHGIKQEANVDKKQTIQGAPPVITPPPPKPGTEKKPMTEGQWRVGLDFNPSGDKNVTEIKELSAALIDRMLDIAANRDNPGARNAAIAATEYENAAMNAVKAVTKQPR